MVPDHLKQASLTLLSSLEGFAQALKTWLEQGSTTPPPVTGGTPPGGDVQISWDWDKKPFPGEQLTFGAEAKASGCRGEVLGFVLENKSGVTISETETAFARVKLFEMAKIKTDKPGYVGAPVGEFYDPLIPRKQISEKGFFWADIEIKRDAQPGAYEIKLGPATLKLTVWKMTLPVRPTMPLYMGLMPMPLLKHHGYTNTAGVNDHGPLILKYARLLREHRIEPFAHYMAGPRVKPDGSVDIDLFAPHSFRDLVLKDRIAGPMFPSRFVSNPDVFLPAVERLIKAEGLTDAWTYAWDEPGKSEYPAVVELIKKVRTLAPSLRTMVTTHPWPEFAPWLQIPCPVLNHYNYGDYPKLPAYAGKELWLYEACMARGSCSKGVVGKPIGTPMLADIDAPAVHTRAFPLICYQQGAKAALYYTVNEHFKYSDPWGVNLYDFGGWGDGALVFPGKAGDRGLTEHTAIGSIRLKLTRTGMNDAELAAMAKARGISMEAMLIKGPREWSKVYGDYQVWRNKIGEALNQ